MSHAVMAPLGVRAEDTGNESDHCRANAVADFGGAEEDRTPDLRIANATLSQLSYGPVFFLL